MTNPTKPSADLVAFFLAPFGTGIHGDTSKAPIAVALLSNGEAQVAFFDGTQVRQPARERQST